MQFTETEMHCYFIPVFGIHQNYGVKIYIIFGNIFGRYLNIRNFNSAEHAVDANYT